MAFAARLKTLSALGELLHKGALNTPQFDDIVPRAKAAFLQRDLPTLARCGGYDVAAPSTERRASSFHSITAIGRDWLDNFTPVMAAGFGESHPAKRR